MGEEEHIYFYHYFSILFIIYDFHFFFRIVYSYNSVIIIYDLVTYDYVYLVIIY
jgi:hypothetical protein